MKVTYEEHLEKRKREERNNTPRFVRNVTKRQICHRQEVRRDKYGKYKFFEEEYA